LLRRLLLLVGTIALAVIVPTAAYGYGNLPVTVTSTLNPLSSQNPSGPPGAGVGSNNDYTVCHPTGLGQGVSANFSNGDLTIHYTGNAVGGGTSAVLSAWNQYRSCMTTAPSTNPHVVCHELRSMNGLVEACSMSFATKTVQWGSSTPGAPGTSGQQHGVSGATSKCVAELSNPTVTVNRPSVASMQYLPKQTWLMNLPVEYTYTNGAVPTPQLSGQTNASCATKFLRSQIQLSEPGLTAAHQTATFHQYSYATVNLQISNFQPAGGHLDGTYVSMVLADNPGQIVANLRACDNPPSLITPPNEQGDLAAYADFYNNRGICTVTPSTSVASSFESVAINKQPIIFELNQEWTFTATYDITGSITRTSGYYTIVKNSSGDYVRTANQYSATYTKPYIGGTQSGSVTVQSIEYKSKPIILDYVTGRECSLYSGSISCPSVGS